MFESDLFHLIIYFQDLHMLLHVAIAHYFFAPVQYLGHLPNYLFILLLNFYNASSFRAL